MIAAEATFLGIIFYAYEQIIALGFKTYQNLSISLDANLTSDALIMQ